MKLQRSAFTLVELSIVLVILGLLVGGVLTGQSLIRAAELRSVTSDYSRYRTAIYAFRDKYFALPGDMGNATAFWGIRTGSSSTTGSDNLCHQVLNTIGGTCNGLQDDILLNSALGANYDSSERYLFWQHLGLAGLIEGRYSGSVYVTGGSPPPSPAGFSPPNQPPARLSGAFWSAAYWDGASPQVLAGNTFSGNVIRIVSYASSYQLMSPEDAWNIDTKMDDALPGSGAVIVFKNTSTSMPNCASTDDSSTAVYSVLNKAKVCSPHVKL